MAGKFQLPKDLRIRKFVNKEGFHSTGAIFIEMTTERHYWDETSPEAFHADGQIRIADCNQTATFLFNLTHSPRSTDIDSLKEAIADLENDIYKIDIFADALQKASEWWHKIGDSALPKMKARLKELLKQQSKKKS